MQIKFNGIIAIDPDLHKSGVVLYNLNTQKFEYFNTLQLYDLFVFLIENKNCLILLEFSKNTNTWHKGGKGAALNVGKNKAVAIIIKEFLEQHNFNFKLLPPAGYSNVFKNPKIFKAATNITKQTNNDVRAAAAMIYFNLKTL